MFINWRLRELNLKIVYYGAGRSGKTTNLIRVHERINPAMRGELTSLKTNEDRTIFFDYMQMELGKVGGLKPKIHLYTVPGQVYYAATRKLVLRGADGVVFVVDSQAGRLEDNIAAWQDMNHYLHELGLDDIPVVVQLNKRDLPDAMPVDTLIEAIGLEDYQVFEAIAIDGKGVLSTLKAVISRVTARIHEQLAAVSQKR